MSDVFTQTFLKAVQLYKMHPLRRMIDTHAHHEALPILEFFLCTIGATNSSYLQQLNGRYSPGREPDEVLKAGVPCKFSLFSGIRPAPTTEARYAMEVFSLVFSTSLEDKTPPAIPLKTQHRIVDNAALKHPGRYYQGPYDAALSCFLTAMNEGVVLRGQNHHYRCVLIDVNKLSEDALFVKFIDEQAHFKTFNLFYRHSVAIEDQDYIDKERRLRGI